MEPFIAELNHLDKATLYNYRLERFQSYLSNPDWFGVTVRSNYLFLEANNPAAIELVIVNFRELTDTATIVLGVSSIVLTASQQQIAVYTKGECNPSLVGIEMQTLERNETVTSNQNQTLNNTASTNADYLSLPQLREMAVALSGENEEFIAWLEASGMSLPTQFISGTPYFQKKAIAKAAEQWNNSKIQGVLSRFLGMPGGIRTDSVAPTPAAPTTTAKRSSNKGSSGEPLKNLRTPPGFKPVKTGKDRYNKTVAALAAAIKPDKWGEYVSHILEGDSLGEPFLKRIAANYSEKDAFAKLHKTFQDYSNSNSQTAA